MRVTPLLVGLLVAALGVSAQAQRRSGGSATLVLMVMDPAGTPLGGVRVKVDGPATRQATTEQGRITFENLPAGTYRLRFDFEGFVPLEREVTARGGAPIDVKVTLTPAPAPPREEPLPAPVQAAAPPANAEPVTIDMPSFIEKNFIGRAQGKVSPLACGTGGAATLIQVKEPLAEHAHADADEFFYVIAGDGTGRAGGHDQALHAGVFMMVPRGVSHSLTATGRGPLVVLSIRAGEKCGGGSR